jgi:methionyl-tRNA formyltransferase
MFMDAGLDTGDMLLKEEFPIGPDTTLEEVHDGLMNLGAKVLLATLEQLSDGTLQRIPQTGESNYAPMLDKETGHIHWQDPAQKIHDLVRGLDSWPGAYTFLAGKKYKIWRTRLTGGRIHVKTGYDSHGRQEAGTFGGSRGSGVRDYRASGAGQEAHESP